MGSFWVTPKGILTLLDTKGYELGGLKKES